MASDFTDALQSRVHRILRPMQHIHLPGSALVETFVGSHPAIFEPDERVAAIYQNSQPDTQHVVFTDTGIHYHNDVWMRLYYTHIRTASVLVDSQDENAKSEARTITITSDHSPDVNLTFDGGNSPYRDVWEISRFINRVKSIKVTR